MADIQALVTTIPNPVPPHNVNLGCSGQFSTINITAFPDPRTVSGTFNPTTKAATAKIGQTEYNNLCHLLQAGVNTTDIRLTLDPNDGTKVIGFSSFPATQALIPASDVHAIAVKAEELVHLLRSIDHNVRELLELARPAPVKSDITEIAPDKAKTGTG
jgi:hypothetical protein